jgi:flagellar protein FlaJ
MAGTFVSGEPENIFLKREAAVQGETYSNAYERDLQTLKNWTDAYIALLLSASLIIIVGVISMMIYPVQDTFIMFLAFLTIVVTVAGAWVIHRAAPKEIKTHSLSTISQGQKLSKFLVKTVVPFGVLVCTVMALLHVDIGWIMLMGSATVLPPGLVILWDDRKIDKQDNDISGVIRSLGGAAKAISSTISHAVSKLDIKATHSLQGCISRLQTRLQTGINPSICWEMFVGETGSEQIHRSMYIFRDAVNFGADPAIASDQASLYAMKINLLRAKRSLVSSNFTWLCLVMHGVVCALMLFIYGVLKVFSEAIGSMSDLQAETNMSLPQFGFMGDTAQMNLFGTLVIVIIIIFTIANAFAVRAAAGGHHYKFFFYLGITMFMAGISLIAVPSLVGAALGTMAPIT